eukprot:TRINITY_DN1633_c0_g2_i1.p1 TRINITY_DN1633_c0_g2~~TRINITY_DN1633_c0_g2_i1.p1  ORF type:complete len:487 (-),score=49.45 TRINITY_DN1633_c0_g2_i1:864-2144(-)
MTKLTAPTWTTVNILGGKQVTARCNTGEIIKVGEIQFYEETSWDCMANGCVYEAICTKKGHISSDNGSTTISLSSTASPNVSCGTDFDKNTCISTCSGGGTAYMAIGTAGFTEKSVHLVTSVGTWSIKSYCLKSGEAKSSETDTSVTMTKLANPTFTTTNLSAGKQVLISCGENQILDYMRSGSWATVSGQISLTFSNAQTDNLGAKCKRVGHITSSTGAYQVTVAAEPGPTFAYSGITGGRRVSLSCSAETNRIMLSTATSGGFINASTFDWTSVGSHSVQGYCERSGYAPMTTHGTISVTQCNAPTKSETNVVGGVDVFITCAGGQVLIQLSGTVWNYFGKQSNTFNLRSAGSFTFETMCRQVGHVDSDLTNHSTTGRCKNHISYARNFLLNTPNKYVFWYLHTIRLPLSNIFIESNAFGFCML